jgi:hypothetical protein
MRRRTSPLVTQAELSQLMEKDRSDIERELKNAERLLDHPRRGVHPISYEMINEWRRFVQLIEAEVQYLEQQRSVSDLERVVRRWQDIRREIVPPHLRWRRRADVIPIADELLGTAVTSGRLRTANNH